MHSSEGLTLLRRFYSLVVRTSLPRIQSLLSLNNLNSIELSGSTSRFTGVKLVKNAVFSFPFYLGRTIRGTRFDNPDSDVFSNAFKDQTPECFDVEVFSEKIAQAYSHELTLRVKDKLSIHVNSQLGNMPLWAMAYPWERESPDFKIREYPKKVWQNRNPSLTCELPPVSMFMDSYSFGRSHGNQFFDLLKSIQANGFQQGRSLPCVYILRSGSEWRWIMSGSGNHRAYILKFLGFQELPAQIVGVVNRDKIWSLPLVRKGFFTRGSAERIFDSVFMGDVSLRGII